jgi:double-stranded uracil-DNA glycosylase
VGYTREQLLAFRDATVPDLIGDKCRLVFVGINPGLWTAATETHFCHPSNRFYPALRLAGLIDFEVDTDTGMTLEQREALISRGIGITNLVARATIRGSELTALELRSGVTAVERVIARCGAGVVAFAGVTAYRTAFARPSASIGPQHMGFSGADVWVVPNPSGLNAHETIGSLAEWFGRVGQAAGLR